MDRITATRDGQTRQFTRKQWEVMGIGKCGWLEEPAIPKEVVYTLREVVTVGKDGAMYSPPGAVKAEGILDFAKPTQKRKMRRK